MPKGTIKKIMDLGFGFINTEEGKDLFFHRNECEGLQFSSLKVGQEVEFELGLDKKGRQQAVKVRLAVTQAPEPPSSQLEERESPKVIELGAPPTQTQEP